MSTDSTYTNAGIAGVGVCLRQCLRCGAIVGGWSPEIGNGEWQHSEWHNALDAALRSAAPVEQ